jgi:hypothetical protein
MRTSNITYGGSFPKIVFYTLKFVFCFLTGTWVCVVYIDNSIVFLYLRGRREAVRSFVMERHASSYAICGR